MSQYYYVKWLGSHKCMRTRNRRLRFALISDCALAPPAVGRYWLSIKLSSSIGWSKKIFMYKVQKFQHEGSWLMLWDLVHYFYFSLLHRENWLIYVKLRMIKMNMYDNSYTIRIEGETSLFNLKDFFFFFFYFKDEGFWIKTYTRK